MFCFSSANHASTNLKTFLSSRLDKFTLSTHSFVGWNLENLYKQAVSILFSLKLIFLSEKNPYFGKHLFAKQELITRARLRGQGFATVRTSLLIRVIQRVLRFFSEKLFYKSNRKRFSCVYIRWHKHSRGWENSRQLREWSLTIGEGGLVNFGGGLRFFGRPFREG